MFLYIEFVCDNIRPCSVTIALPDINVAVISLYESATNLTLMGQLETQPLVQPYI